MLPVLVIAMLIARADAEPVPRLQLNARHIPAAFRSVVAGLLARTKGEVVFPQDMRWAHDPRPLVGCIQDADRTSYAYYVIARGTSSTCAPENDIMFYYATLDVGPWAGPYLSYGTRIDLGRGVDGDLLPATGFDDPGLPRTDLVTWHLGRTSFSLNVRFGDAVALARSIVANLADARLPHRLLLAPSVGGVDARHVATGLAVGVAELRRLTRLPIDVPDAPAIDASVQLFPLSHDADAYSYVLCRTIACSPKSGLVAEVSAEKVARRSAGSRPNIDLGCGERGDFEGLERDAGELPTAFALLTWQQKGTSFTIMSAKDNPAHTDIVRLGRSIVSNSCRPREMPGR